MQKKIRKFKFGKLVRDKIVDGIISVGNKPIFRKLKQDEYIQELKNKLLEEVEEFPKAKNKTELLEEVADFEEIMDNLLSVLNVKREDIKKIQKVKNQKRGSFKKRLYINYVETTDSDSEYVKYYLANPDKYPEIK